MTPIREILDDILDPQRTEYRGALEAEIEQNNLLSRRLTLLRNSLRETERKLAASEERIRHLKARLDYCPIPFPSTAGGIAYEDREQ